MNANSARTVSVVVPVYKIELANSEVSSLHQCLNLLKNYTITFICSNSFDFDAFCRRNRIKDQRKCIEKVEFPKEFFASVEGYNSLLSLDFFYSAFSQFEYILIYQLDAWVFKDELEFWMSQGYDYIGAPWINFDTCESVLLGVGNGGFSLRRVNSFQNVLRSFKFKYSPFYSFPDLLERYFLSHFEKQSLLLNGFDKSMVLLKSCVRSTSYRNNLNYLKSSGVNEDIFWGIYVPTVFTDFKVASIDVASKFSIETSPELIMSRIAPKLPFGCHAWEKWGKDFWQPYIESSASFEEQPTV